MTISKYLKEDTFVKAHGGQRYGTFGHGVISSHQPVQNTRRCAAMCTSAETNDQYDSVCWSYQYNDVTKTCDLFAAWFAGNILEEVRFGLTKAAIASVSVYSGKVAIVTLIDLTISSIDNISLYCRTQSTIIFEISHSHNTSTAQAFEPGTMLQKCQQRSFRNIFFIIFGKAVLMMASPKACRKGSNKTPN